MKPQLETPNRVAFERYAEAVSCMEIYRTSGQRDLIEKTVALLEEAHSADPEWVRPPYLQSILKDLTGDPQATILELETRFGDLPASSFAFEVKYNLGAAHYHRYGEKHLEKAESLFEEVKLRASKDLRPLPLLASASLAQVYGMRVLLKQPENAAQLEEAAKKWYHRCLAEAERALRELKKWRTSKGFQENLGDAWIADEIEWIATNAMGIGGVFWSDYLSPTSRMTILSESISLFQKGLRLRPNHWATLCNLASAKMRLGYALSEVGQASQGDRMLQDALGHIDFVLTAEIRPDYAFALYERGRILRLMGRFEDAVESLSRLRKVPAEKRDVSPVTFEPEIKRAQDGETYFLRKRD